MKRFLQPLLLVYCLAASGQSEQPQTRSAAAPGTNVFYDYYTTSRPDLILPSPQAMLFDRVPDHSIQEAYGLADISIPLHEIEIKGVKIPIVLNYHSGGVRYYQYDGDVGANWTLNVAGYKISRTVRGKDDFDTTVRDRYTPESFREVRLLDGSDITKTGKYFEDSYLVKTAFTPAQAQHVEFGYSNDAGPFRDGEYDHFTFSTPTGSGHFIMDGATPHELELSARKLEMNKDRGKVTDEYGNEFLFGGSYREQTERVLPINGDRISSFTGWSLYSIVNPYSEKIEFKYAARQIWGSRTHDLETILRVVDPMTNMVIGVWGDPETGSEINSRILVESSGLYGNPTYHTAQYLQEIKTDHENIEIVRTTATNLCPVKSGRAVNSPWMIDQIIITGENYKKTIKFNYKTSPENVTITSNDTPWHILLKSVEFLGSDNTVEKKYSFDYNEPTGKLTIKPDLWGYYGSPTSNRLAIYEPLSEDKVLNQFYNSQTLAGDRYLRTLRQRCGSSASDYFSTRAVNNTAVQYFSLKSIKYPTGGTTEYEYEPHRYKSYSGGERVGGGLRVKRIISRPGDESPVFETRYEYGQGVVTADIEPASFLGWSFFIGFYCSGGNPAGTCRSSSDNPRFNAYADEVLHNITRMYSEEPMDEAYSVFSVNYPQVTTRSYDSQGRHNGSTVANFAISSPYSLGYCGENEPTLSYYNSDYPIAVPWGLQPTHIRKQVYMADYSYYQKPHLGNRKYYNAQGNPVLTEEYKYTGFAGREFDNLKPIKFFTFENLYDTHGNMSHNLGSLNMEAYAWITSFFDYYTYTVTSGNRLLSEKKTTHHFAEGNVVETESYVYNNKYQVSAKNITNSSGDNISQTFTYPTSGALLNKNMHSTVLEQVTKLRNGEIGRIKNIYQGTQVVPSQIQTSTTGASGLRTDITFHQYDSKGNLQHYTTLDGLSTVILWSYKQKYPVAEIKNATFSAVTTALGSTGATFINTLATTTAPTAAQMNTLNGLRTSLPDAQVSTFTYRHPYGMLSATDPRGVTTYYTYDAYGRLIKVSMKETPASEEVILETYNYNYRNQ